MYKPYCLSKVRQISKWQEIESWDWKSISKAALILGAGMFVIFSLLNKGHFIKALNDRDMPETIPGFIIDRSESTNLIETRTGNHLIVTDLTVKYVYQVNGKRYTQQEILYYSVIDAPKLNAICKGILPIKINIAYDPQDPQHSAVDLK